ETSMDPKLVIWNGESYNNAKAYAPHVVSTTATWGSSDTVPAINSKYNTNGDMWRDLHYPEHFIRGSGIAGVPSDPGYIIVSDPLGIYEISQKLRLLNYPLFVAPGFQNSLWDWFHWIDDPNLNRSLHMEWKLKIEKCCEDLERLGLTDGSDISTALTGKVLLPVKYLDSGMITTIVLNLDPDGETGPYIELKGTL